MNVKSPATAADSVVSFVNVRKAYGRSVAVHDLNLDIGRGQFVTLLGPSGCGKSTTLRMLGGFEEPTSGRIILDGRDVTDVPPNRRNVNIVFQDYALFPHLSAARNIAFGLEMRAVPRDAIARRVRDLLALVHLEEFGDRQPGELSGGQRQRIALMRALAPDPQVLLLDEPLSALDAKLRHQMQIELKSIQSQTGKTFLFVTHDQEEALTMSDQVVVMNSGRIEQMGDPETLYRRPRSRFVASFIGEANFLDARVLGREGDGWAVEWAGQRFGAQGDEGLAAGGQRTVVVRPESIVVQSERPAQRAAAQGRIVRRIFRGNLTALTIKASGAASGAAAGGAAGGAEVTASVGSAALDALTGDDVWLSWNPENATILND